MLGPGSTKWAGVAALTVALFVGLFFVFRLGNQASAGVALNDPVVWIEHGLRGELLQVNGATREITARVTVGEPGDDIVAIPRNRDAVYLNRTSGEVGVVGAVSLEVDNVDALVDRGEPVTGPEIELLGDLDVSTDAFIVTPTSVITLEPGAGIRRTIQVADGLGDTAIAGDGRLVALTVGGDQLLVSDPGGLVALASVETPIEDTVEASQVVRAADGLYVVDPPRRSVREVSADGVPGATTCVAGSLENVLVGGNPADQVGSEPRILVHSPESGVLSVSDPANTDCFPVSIDAEGEFGPPIAVGNLAYLPNYSLGTIHVVDLNERVVIDDVAFSTRLGERFELEVFDGAVWANEPQGRRAAILRGLEIERISKISQGLVSEQADGESGIDVAVAGDAETDDRVFGSSGDLIGGSLGEETVGGEDGLGAADESGLGETDDALEGSSSNDEAPPGAPPLLIDGIEASAPTPPPDELAANFSFTADQVNVGETVVFTDTSTGAPISWNWDFGDGTGGEGPEVAKAWEVEGSYTVTLFVTDATGNESSQSLEVTVLAVDVLTEPTAFFSFRSGTIEVGETIVFTDRSTGDADTLLWDLGDGTQASGAVVEHEYGEPGEYIVELTAANAAGSDSTRATVTVVEAVRPPEAIIGGFPRVVQTGQSVVLASESTNSPTSTSWDFDDGETGLGTDVRHAWDEPGTYRIRLLVSNSAGSDETFADIVVEPSVIPPVARFSESALQAIVGEELNFTSLSLNNPTSVSWEFGDNSTAQGANVVHAWDSPGTYRVTLTVANDAGTDETSKTVTVSPPPPDPPIAAFTISNATVPVNAVIQFTDTSQNDPASWQWDFGDGSGSSAQSPPHAFSTPGTYEVSLTVSNVSGSDTVTKTIIVIDPPVAGFSVDVDELAVEFADTSTNGPTSWQWDFGDGTSSTAQNPSKTYALPGNYTVTLIATNAAGSSSPVSTPLVLAEAPTASFATVTSGLTAQFTDTSTNTPTSWLWEFGDGTTSTSQNPQHTYAVGDTYTVRLTVANAGGSSTTTEVVTVQVAPPVADFSCQVLQAGVACDGSTSTATVAYSWSASPSPINASGLATPTPIFTFGSSGDYDITLTVENSVGVTDSLTKTFTVTVPEPPEITTINVVANSGGEVELAAVATNSPTSWSWQAPGATISGGTTSSPTLTYGAPGTYTAEAVASNAVGASAPETVTFTVTILMPPVVTAVSETSNAGGSVVLSGTATNSPTSWTWAIPGGTITSGATTSSPTLVFTTNGTYTGSVTAANADGTSAAFSVTVVVDDLPPTVTSVVTAPAGVGAVTLTGAATNSPTGWTWSIPGGTITAGAGTAAPTFSFPANGTYTGTVVAANAVGTSAAFPVTVTVNTYSPTASFTWVDSAAPQRIRFTDTSTALAGATLVWDFGGGTVVNGLPDSPRVDYPSPGSYTVTLTVTDAAGTDTTTTVITVN